MNDGALLVVYRKNWTSSWTVLQGSSLLFAKGQGSGTSWVGVHPISPCTAGLLFFTWSFLFHSISLLVLVSLILHISGSHLFFFLWFFILSSFLLLPSPFLPHSSPFCSSPCPLHSRSPLLLSSPPLSSLSSS